LILNLLRKVLDIINMYIHNIIDYNLEIYYKSYEKVN